MSEDIKRRKGGSRNSTDGGSELTIGATAATGIPPNAGRSISAVVSPAQTPGTTNAALWRQNAELQQRCQELALEVQGLRAASARRRLSTLSGSRSASVLGSRRGSSAASEEKEGLPSQIAALEAQLAEARASATAALAGRQAAEAAAAVAQEGAKQAQEELRTEQRGLAAARDQLSATRTELEAGQRKAATMQAQLEAARAEAAVARAGVAQLSEQLAATRDELCAARSQAGEVEGALRAELSDLQGRLVASEAQARKGAAQLATMEQEAARLRAEAAGLRLELSDARSTLAGAQAALADARVAVKAAEGTAASAAADHAAVAALEQRFAEFLRHAEAPKDQANKGQALGSSRATRWASRSSNRSLPPSPRPAASLAGARSEPTSPRRSGSPGLAQQCCSPSSTHGSKRHHSMRVVCSLVLPAPAEGGSSAESEGAAVADLMRELESEVRQSKAKLHRSVLA